MNLRNVEQINPLIFNYGLDYQASETTFHALENIPNLK